MIALPAYDPPAIIEPAPPLTEVRKRRRRGSTNWDQPDRNHESPAPRRSRVSIPTWLFIGAVLFGDDGKPCTVVHIDDVRGLYYCVPVQQ